MNSKILKYYLPILLITFKTKLNAMQHMNGTEKHEYQEKQSCHKQVL